MDYFRLRVTPLEQDEKKLRDFEERLRTYFAQETFTAIGACREYSIKDTLHYHIGFYSTEKRTRVTDNFRKHFVDDIGIGNRAYSFGEDRTLNVDAYRRYMCKGASPAEIPIIIFWQARINEPSIRELHDQFWKNNEQYRGRAAWDKIRQIAPTSNTRDLVTNAIQILAQHNLDIDVYRVAAKIRSILCATDTDTFHNTVNEVLSRINKEI